MLYGNSTFGSVEIGGGVVVVFHIPDYAREVVLYPTILTDTRNTGPVINLTCTNQVVLSVSLSTQVDLNLDILISTLTDGGVLLIPVSTEVILYDKTRR